MRTSTPYIWILLKSGSRESLVRAQEVFGSVICSEKSEQMRSKDWSDVSQITADAYYIHSSLAAVEGQLSKALFFARLCVKNCQRSWAILERSQNRVDGATRKGPNGNENDPLVDGMSELSISASTEIKSTRHSMLSGIAFWSLVPRLIRGLTHLSLLFSYNGLYSEVRYYLQQGQEVAKAVEAASRSSQTTALLGSYSIRSGEVSEGVLLVQHAENLVTELPRDRSYAFLQLVLANHHTKQGELRAAECAIGIAESTIQNLVAKSFIDNLVQRRSPTPNLEVDLSALTIQEARPARTKQSRQRQANPDKLQSKSVTERDASTLSSEEAPAIEVFALQQMRHEIIRGRIYAKISGGALDAAASLLNETIAHARDQQDLVLQALLASRIHFRQGLQHFVSDPVLCVIPESILSCPAIKVCTSNIQDKQIRLSSPPKSKSHTSSRSATGKALARKVKPRSPSLANDQVKFLRLAQDEITKIFRPATTSSATATVYEISDVLGKVLMVLSAVSAASSRNSIPPGVLSYFLGESTKEIGRRKIQN